MSRFVTQSIEGFLDALADRTPSPGGGGAAALAGATGSAQARMVIAYSLGKNTEASKRARLERAERELAHCDGMFRALMDEDATAYEQMVAAGQAAKIDPSQQEAHRAAVVTAAAVPLEMVAVASTALKALDDVKADASRYLVSDAGVAAALLDAAARAAACSVRVNVRDMEPGEPRDRIRCHLDDILTHCGQHHRSVQAYVGPYLG